MKTIIQIDKHKVKYIITACIPIIIIIIQKNFLPDNYKKIFFFAKYKNGKPRVKFIIK